MVSLPLVAVMEVPGSGNGGDTIDLGALEAAAEERPTERDGEITICAIPQAHCSVGRDKNAVLTSRGVQQVKAIGSWLVQWLGPRSVRPVWVSLDGPAVQTAAAIKEEIGAQRLEACEWLSAERSVGRFLAQLCDDAKDVVVAVGPPQMITALLAQAGKRPQSVSAAFEIYVFTLNRRTGKIQYKWGVQFELG